MTSSTRDRRTIASGESWSAERLDALLSAIASTPDFAAAARLFVARLADAVGAERGYALMLDLASGELLPLATLGYEEQEPPRPHVVDDRHDPLVVAALSMLPVSCPGPAVRSKRGTSRVFLALPFPQPRVAKAPRFLGPVEAQRTLRSDCVLHVGWDTGGEPASADDGVPGSLRGQAGHSPCGVVVLETTQRHDEILQQLMEASLLAGPVLWRLAANEAHARSTEQLDEQRSVLTSIVNSLPDPIVIINDDHQIVVQNRRAEHLLSMGEHDSDGRRRAVEINNLLFTSHLSKTAMAPGASGGAGARELNMVDPDEGTDLLFEVLTQPLDETQRATVSVLRDVTDLRRAANELEQQIQRVRLAEFEAKRERDRLNLILANVADPILVTDDRSNIILMNRRAEHLFGAIAPESSEHDGSRTAAVRANDTRFTTFISDFGLSPDVERREEMTLSMPDTSRGEIPMEVVSGKILDNRGESIAIVSVLHDLTEQAENERLYEEVKRFNSELEARVRAATSDLAEQNVRLQWQSRELERANRLKSEFLASMSHELRTPINALIGYTALLLDRIYGELTTRQEEGLTRIQAAAQHLLALINDILDLAKIEAGRMPLHLDDVVLQDVVREVVVHMDPLVRKRGLRYRWTAPDEPIRMYTDRTKVKQIMLNLLSNAVKFTHTGGITLIARQTGDLVHIDVVDTGIGIRREDLTGIWEDFRQVDQSRTREFGGTGLGLSITRKLVEALGGSVALESEYGVGSTFSVALPVRTVARPEKGSSTVSGGSGAALTDGVSSLD